MWCWGENEPSGAQTVRPGSLQKELDIVKQLNISAQQIPSSVTHAYIEWQIEQPNGDIILVELERRTGKFQASLTVWDDTKQDWVGELLVWDEIKHTIPTLVC